MTDFMTALALILVRLRCSEQRERGAQIRLSCDHCQESHKTQVWLCFLILSVLSTSTCAASTPVKAEVQHCLKRLKPTIEKSDALLYAPSVDDITENCKIMSLKCYISELGVILFEEDQLKSEEADCIHNFNETLPSQDSAVSCPPCEAQTVKNATIFLERMIILLQSMDFLEK
ncbi:interleukin-15 isoform X1 [Centroberyx affinis]|uniref:interleukin-15 isoform X1 n=1 Tax=Centroberyx affinis TaxID=166261 RepID=UPI003A5C5332